jgi:type III secretory pathway component EscU
LATSLINGIIEQATMKRILPLILIISLFGMAVLGSVLMIMDQNHPGGCIASEDEGTDCPTAIAAFTFHHIDALQSILMSLVSPIPSMFLVLSLLVVIAFVFSLFSKNLAQPKLNILQKSVRDVEISFFHGQQKIFSWLSLFELSPAI